MSPASFPASVSAVGVSALEGAGGAGEVLPSVPGPVRVWQEGLGWPGGLICLFLEVHLEHGLSKVYIFIFLYQGLWGSVGREGGYLAVYFLLE